MLTNAYVKCYNFNQSQYDGVLAQLIERIYYATNSFSPELRWIEAAPPAIATKALWQEGQTTSEYFIRWQRLQSFSYNRYTYFGCLGGTQLFLLQLWKTGRYSVLSITADNKYYSS